MSIWMGFKRTFCILCAFIYKTLSFLERSIAWKRDFSYINLFLWAQNLEIGVKGKEWCPEGGQEIEVRKVR